MRSPTGSTDTTCAPEGSVMRSANEAPVADRVEAAGDAEVEPLDMRRAISAATTMKPTTINRPMTITRTFSQSGAEGWEGEAGAGDAKKTPWTKPSATL